MAFDLSYLGDHDGIIGVDEAGRGCLAGPVVAGAVYIAKHLYGDKTFHSVFCAVNDSKQLSERRREICYALIEQWAKDGNMRFASGIGSVSEIEKLNILGANRLAMQRAIEAVSVCPVGEKILVDGLPLKPFPYRHEGIVKGDAKSLAVACASVVAKVTRDRMMQLLDAEFPGYGLAVHKGYATADHQHAILELGASSCHREKFLRKLKVKESQMDLGL